MQTFNFSFDHVGSFSKTDVAYQHEDSNLAPFYKYSPTIESLKQVIEDKRNAPDHRALLSAVLAEQYQNAGVSVPENVSKLAHPDTFTITTAHQPSLFTGPLYVILKIASTINLTRKLNEQVDDHIIPVFIIGGEDHDFEEINHLSIFGNRIEWETKQTGPVGRMTLDGINEAKEAISQLLGQSEKAQELTTMLDKAYTGAHNYGSFSFLFLQQIFADTELVILQMDHPKLKSAFKEIIQQEVLDSKSFDLVQDTQKEIERAGFSPQAFVREINFFYLTEGRRDRIESEGETFKVVDTNITFSRTEMENEIDQHPERFSPNVIIRPLFQELVLPNLAYIGGGGELAYWLERKTQFEAYGINYPMLIRRNSILWVDPGSVKQLKKLDLKLEDIFGEEEALIKEWVKDHTAEELSIDDALSHIAKAFEEIEEKAEKIDPTLVKTIAGEKTKVLKSTEQLGGRLIRSQKQKHEVSLNQIRKVKQKLFPNGGLQERSENFMSIYLRNGGSMITYLIDQLNPLEKDFKVLVEEAK